MDKESFGGEESKGIFLERIKWRSTKRGYVRGIGLYIIHFNVNGFQVMQSGRGFRRVRVKEEDTLVVINGDVQTSLIEIDQT
jgi:hypothetical protein